MATENLDLELIQLSDNIQTSMLEKMNDNFEKIDAAYETLKNNLLNKTGKTTLSEAISYVNSLVNANDATATADKIFNGYTAYKGTTKITGTALATTTNGSAATLLDGRTLYNYNGSLITGSMANKSGTSTNANGSISGDFYRLQIPATGYYTTSSYVQRSKNNVLNDLGVKAMPTINLTLTGVNTTVSGYITGHGAGIDNNGKLVIWAMSSQGAYEHINFVNTSIGAGTIGNGWNITSFDTSSPTSFPQACTLTGLGSYSTINITLNASATNTTNDYITVKVTLTAS